MCYYIGILVLTVFCISHVQSQDECQKALSSSLLDEIKEGVSGVTQDSQNVYLYQKMKRTTDDFVMHLFDCDDVASLYDEWDNLEKKLLKKIKKTCPDFESSYEEIETCRVNLDVYSFDKDQTRYCSIFEKCTGMQERLCPALKDLVLLEDRQSNASVNFCTVECDDIPKLRKVLANCWASAQINAQSSTGLFEVFSDCVMAGNTRPTCRISKKMISRIFPLFHDQAHEIISETVSEKPESECIQTWKAWKDIEYLNPSMCKTLEGMKTCITTSLKGDDTKRYKEKLAKCQYSLVNLIRTEALRQATEKPTSAPSTAAGTLGSGTYHLAVMCWLVSMVTYYFNNII